MQEEPIDHTSIQINQRQPDKQRDHLKVYEDGNATSKYLDMAHLKGVLKVPLENFTVWETDLIRQLGVNRKSVEQVRRIMLEPKKDWVMYGKRIWLTLDAAQRVAARFVQEGAVEMQIEATPVEPSQTAAKAEKPPEPEAPKAPVLSFEIFEDGQRIVKEAIVIKAKYLNKHVILVEDGHKERFTVWVTSSENFRPGMTIKCTKTPMDSMHQLVGRCPRFPGKW